MTILAWLMGSSLGRTVALVGMAVLAALLAVATAFGRGRTAERSKQAAAALNNLKTRIADEDSIHALPADQRRDRLREWSRG